MGRGPGIVCMLALATLACGRVDFDAAACLASDPSCELGAWQPFGGTGTDSSTRIVWGIGAGGGLSNSYQGVNAVEAMMLVGGEPQVAFRAAVPDEDMVFVRGPAGDVVPPRPTASIANVIGLDVSGFPIVANHDIPTGVNTFERWDSTSWIALPPIATGDPFAVGSDASGAPLVIMRTSPAMDLFAYRFDGTSWQPMGGQINTPGQSGISLELVIGPTPMVCWTEGSAFPRRIQLRQWDGTSWAPLGTSTSNTFAAGVPTCSYDQTGAPLLAWSNLQDVFAMRWSGTAWDPLFPGSTTGTGLSDTPAGARALGPRLAVDGNRMLVLWIEETVIDSRAYFNLWYRAGTFGQLSPRTPMNGGGGLTPPAVVVDAQGRFCTALVRGAGDLNVICHADGAWHGFDGDPAPVPGISASPGDAFSPELVASDDGRVELVWSEVEGNARHAYTRQLVDGRWLTRGTSDASGTGVSGDSDANTPTIALGANGSTWLMWHHDSNCLMARRWDGSAWIEAPSGSADPATCGVWQDFGLDITDPHVIVDASDQVWAAWSSDCWEYNVYAGTFDGSAWSVVGKDICEPGLAPRSGFDGRLAHHPSTGLFLSSLGRDDAFAGNHIYVHRWDGTAWSGLAGSDQATGISGDGGAATRRARITVDSQGRPWVTWSSKTSGSWQVYVRFFDGDAWQEVGGSGTGSGVSGAPDAALDPTIVLDGSDRPIVFWSEHTQGTWEIYGRRWTGEVWQALSGSASGGGISNSTAPSTEPSAIVHEDTVCVVWSEPDRDDREIRGRCLKL